MGGAFRKGGSFLCGVQGGGRGEISGEGEVFLGGGDFLQPSISYHCKVE